MVGDDNAILGVVTEGNLSSRLMAGRVKPDDSVTKALFPQFRKVLASTSLAELARIFDRDHFAVVTQTQRTFRGGGEPVEKSVVVAVVTRIDLLKYMTGHAPAGLTSSASTGSLPTAASRAASGAAGGAGAP